MPLLVLGARKASDATADHGAHGLLSAVQAGSKSIDIQTEVFSTPESCIVSTAYFVGRVVMSQKEAFSLEGKNVSDLVRSQHKAMETQIRSLLSSYKEEKNVRSSRPSPKLQPATPIKADDTYFFSGYEAYERNDFETALQCWRAALAEDPDNTFLTVLAATAEHRRDKQGR